MTTRQATLKSVIDQIVHYYETGEIDSIAFAIVAPDGTPRFGHANPSYNLLGAVDVAKTSLAFKMLSDAEDVGPLEPPPHKH